MINEIRSAFKEALDRLNWMDDHTRQAAKDKVRKQMDRQVDRQVDSQVELKVLISCIFCLSLIRQMRSTI